MTGVAKTLSFNYRFATKTTRLITIVQATGSAALQDIDIASVAHINILFVEDTIVGEGRKSKFDSVLSNLYILIYLYIWPIYMAEIEEVNQYQWKKN